MSMLTGRTLHAQLSEAGLLHGEKTASGWRFSNEDIARFWAQPFVNAAVNSIRNCSDVNFAYHYEKDIMRVTLRRKADEIITIMNGVLK